MCSHMSAHAMAVHESPDRLQRPPRTSLEYASSMRFVPVVLKSQESVQAYQHTITSLLSDLCRSRRRQKDSDSDPDYEGERSERSGRSAKARAAAKRSTASNTARPGGGAQHQGFQSQQMQAQRMQVWAARASVRFFAFCFCIGSSIFYAWHHHVFGGSRCVRVAYRAARVTWSLLHA